MNRLWCKDVLTYMLRKLPKEEIIEHFVDTLSQLCEKDEDFKGVVHCMTTYVQACEITLGRSILRNYKEPHRREIFNELLKAHRLDNQMDKDIPSPIVTVFYIDFIGSDLSYNDWVNNVNRRVHPEIPEES